MLQGRNELRCRPAGLERKVTILFTQSPGETIFGAKG